MDDSEDLYISDDSYVSINEQIDTFISNESDNIINLKYDLENRFCYFLDKMNSGDLLSFIVDIKFNSVSDINNYYSDKEINSFINENNNEISVSLWIVNRYLSKFKKIQISYDIWLEFCYKYTSY